jgi:hypothetical protein
MPSSPLYYRLRLLTLRLWQEVSDGKPGEWRGQLRDTATGEVRYFRDWQTLVETMPLLLGELSREDAADGPALPPPD